MCELVPSGIRPFRTILVPPMFSTRLVIGETVATTRSPASEATPLELSDGWEQARVMTNSSAARTKYVFNGSSFLNEVL